MCVGGGEGLGRSYILCLLMCVHAEVQCLDVLGIPKLVQ